MADTYRVKEMFYTLQGEGAHTGRPAVFCRFSKCNLWNGKESARAEAVCHFCDTDFVGTNGQNGGIYTAEELADKIAQLWPQEVPLQPTDMASKQTMPAAIPYVVCTGGEPLLQLDEILIRALHLRGFEIAIETNGTLPVPEGVDWVCLSPKGASNIVVDQCHELKLVYPQQDAPPHRFDFIQAQHRYLQPMDISALVTAGLIVTDNESFQQEGQDTIRATLAYCMAHPEWKLSMQTHKWLGID